MMFSVTQYLYLLGHFVLHLAKHIEGSVVLLLKEPAVISLLLYYRQKQWPLHCRLICMGLDEFQSFQQPQMKDGKGDTLCKTRIDQLIHKHLLPMFPANSIYLRIRNETKKGRAATTVVGVNGFALDAC